MVPAAALGELYSMPLITWAAGGSALGGGEIVMESASSPMIGLIDLAMLMT